ncbi:hypothetical protein HC174_07235 [Salinimicrobium sp. CDJ15-81-2]|uniref:Uncharacterized protein n=1 Tax=Salinimicrobium oceani TaxID=2722702 RepID=A0ABX1D2H1_9FLAO|nr:DUF6730 family protein [Salinimicrobium oceani]NJW54648.1 hypothetical protein [Salinimicrobium oceani]NJY62549.1 hypothetical protein [Salinimicrobium nanhaiense]
MKKLDEIMELMADEMQDFQNGLLQMKKMIEELNTRSIPITTEVMEKQLKIFFQKQQERESLALENLRSIDQKLKNTTIVPRNIIALFGSILLVLVLIIGYLSFELMQSKDVKNEMLQEKSTALKGFKPQRQKIKKFA